MESGRLEPQSRACRRALAFRPLCVLRTGNTPRVRDGYISKNRGGHAALPTHRYWLICRTNMLANERACTP
jgi:hypothetical protein